MRIILAFIALLIAPSAALSEKSPYSSPYNYLELAHSRQNSDFSGFDNVNAQVISGRKLISERLFVSGRYQHKSAQLPVRQQTKRAFSIGLGGKKDWTESFSSHVSLDLVQYSGEGELKKEDGTRINAGLSWDINRRWRLGFELGLLDLFENGDSTNGDTLENEIISTYEIRFLADDKLGLVVRIRDFADYDVTAYEFGIRWEF